jgi:MscS family membrane protein
MDVLKNTYYGNSVEQWLTMLVLFTGSILVARLVYWIFKNWAGRLTRKTATRVDDIILDMLEEPLTYILAITGIKYALLTLSMPEQTLNRIDYGYQFLVTLTIAWLFSRLYEAMHNEYLMPHAEHGGHGLGDNMLPLLRRAVKTIFWALGILIALNNVGYDVSTVIAGLGIGGIAFALAVQHTFSNIVSGINIFIDQHFKVGNRIQFRLRNVLYDGVVEEIGLRTTRIRSRYEGRRISVPNTILASNPVVNVETEHGRQVFTTYKLATDTPAEKIEWVMAELKAIIERHPDTKKDLIVSGLVNVNDVASEIMLLYWISPDASNIKTRTAVNLEILKLFQNNGIRYADRTHHLYESDAPF